MSERKARLIRDAARQAVAELRSEIRHSYPAEHGINEAGPLLDMLSDRVARYVQDAYDADTRTVHSVSQLPSVRYGLPRRIR